MIQRCGNCENAIATTDRYCGYCGRKQQYAAIQKEQDSIRNVLIFYLVYLVYAIASYAIYSESDVLITEIVLESVFVLLTVMFSLLDAKRIIALYSIKYINWKNLLFSVLFPCASAILVYYGVGALNELLFQEDFNLFDSYILYENSFLWAFIFVAIVAPVFEELAFRGFLFNQLLNVANPTVTIITTALIFALVHFSLISIIWIFPFGIILGYLRHKYRTLWLGMIVHFIHNLIVLLLEYHYYTENPLIQLL